MAADILKLTAVESALELPEHTEESSFGRVGDVGKDSVLDVVADHFQQVADEVGTQSLALAVDVGVAASREVDALERALAVVAFREYPAETYVAGLVDDERFAGT